MTSKRKMTPKRKIPNIKITGTPFRAVIGLALAFALTPSQAFASSCMSADEVAAEQVRRLQTTLMVGALQCRNASQLEVRETYNQFIKRYGPVITAHNRILTRYFQRTAGSGFQKVMDAHITQLANSVSRVGYRDHGFCEKVAHLGQESLANGPSDIVAIAQDNTLAPSKMTSCDPTRTQAAAAQ